MKAIHILFSAILIALVLVSIALNIFFTDSIEPKRISLIALLISSVTAYLTFFFNAKKLSRESSQEHFDCYYEILVNLNKFFTNNPDNNFSNLVNHAQEILSALTNITQQKMIASHRIRINTEQNKFRENFNSFIENIDRDCDACINLYDLLLLLIFIECKENIFRRYFIQSYKNNPSVKSKLKILRRYEKHLSRYRELWTHYKEKLI